MVHAEQRRRRSTQRRAAGARGRLRRCLAVLAAITVSAACGGGAPTSTSATPLPSPTAAARTGVPQLRVDVVARGLTRVSDVAVLPDGRALVAQLDGRISILAGTAPGAAIAPVTADLTDLYVRGDAGLMSLVAHPDFGQSRRFTTCQTHADRGVPTDVRLVSWELSADGRSARRIVDPLVGGLPVNTTGVHPGCRLALAADGALLVGTGDSQRTGVSQDLGNLGGKILRVDLTTGGPPLGNPYATEPNPAQRLILDYGHTDVTGIAVDPVTGAAWATELGTTVDDELNPVLPARNYGWDPSRGGTRTSGYDLTAPMTDLVRYPDAVRAAWSSGQPVLGVSGAAFVSGAQWGDLAGQLAVSTAAGRRLLIMAIGADGRVGTITTPPPLLDALGALSGVRAAPGGDLLVITGNGTDDKVLRVGPS